MIFEATFYACGPFATLFPTQDAPGDRVELFEELRITRLRCGNQRIVEGAIGAELRQGNSTRDITLELLGALARAYREAVSGNEHDPMTTARR